MPGTRELHEVEATARRAERDKDEAQEELGALEPRLAKPVDVEAAKAGIARVCEVGLAWHAAQQAQALGESLHEARILTTAILGRIRNFSQRVNQAEQAAGHGLNVPRISLPIEALETLAAAPAPTLVSAPEPLSDSPDRAPARRLRAFLSGARG